MEILAKLGINHWSILVYMVNFGILLLVLTKFLYRPVLDILDKRVALISSSISEAELLKKDFAEKVATMKSEKEEASMAIQQQLTELREEAVIARKKLETELQAERTKMFAALEKEIEAEKVALQEEMKKTMVSSMHTILTSILGDKVPSSALHEYVREGLDHYYARQ